MKRISLALVCLMVSLFNYGQDVFLNKTNAAIEKVLRDYPNHFHNIKGEVITQNSQTIEYRSNIQIPGSSSCILTRFKEDKKEVYTYSWNCTAFKAEEFLVIKNKFKEIYEQIENTIIKIDGLKPFIITGQYRTPNEQRKFTSIVFELLPAEGEIKNIRVAMDLQRESTGWKIVLQVSDNIAKEKSAQGEITSN